MRLSICRSGRPSELLKHGPSAHVLSRRRHSSTFTDHVRIVEVGPRDGLQNESQSIDLDTKLELIRRLKRTGLKTIEAGSFVSPKWVPQMADSSSVLSQLRAESEVDDGLDYHWLVPNAKGLQTFLQTMSFNHRPSSASPKPGKHTVSIFLAATESFSQRNTNCSVAESIERFRPVVNDALGNGFAVRAYISVALGCPFEGVDVSPSKVAHLATTMLDIGVSKVSVADTTGMGTTPRTKRLLATLAAAGVDNSRLALHFHDTYGQALSNVLVGLEHGVRTFDSAVGGLGGCPFSPGATGNLSTEDLVYTLASLGLSTGVDLDSLCGVGEWITAAIGDRQNQSRVGRAKMASLRANKDLQSRTKR